MSLVNSKEIIAGPNIDSLLDKLVDLKEETGNLTWELYNLFIKLGDTTEKYEELEAGIKVLRSRKDLIIEDIIRDLINKGDITKYTNPTEMPLSEIKDLVKILASYL